MVKTCSTLVIHRFSSAILNCLISRPRLSLKFRNPLRFPVAAAPRMHASSHGAILNSQARPSPAARRARRFHLSPGPSVRSGRVIPAGSSEVSLLGGQCHIRVCPRTHVQRSDSDGRRCGGCGGPLACRAGAPRPGTELEHIRTSARGTRV